MSCASVRLTLMTTLSSHPGGPKDPDPHQEELRIGNSRRAVGSCTQVAASDKDTDASIRSESRSFLTRVRLKLNGWSCAATRPRQVRPRFSSRPVRRSTFAGGAQGGACSADLGSGRTPNRTQRRTLGSMRPRKRCRRQRADVCTGWSPWPSPTRRRASPSQSCGARRCIAKFRRKERR